MAGSGYFDDIAPPALADGSVATPEQAEVAARLANQRDAAARAGSAANPSYDTATNVGDQNTYHVTQGGQVATPVTQSGYFDDLPLTQVSKLAQTPAMDAALDAYGKRDPSQTNAGNLRFADGFLWGRAPQVDAAGQYLDTAAKNALARLTGQPVAYGASDAYSATKASDQDRIAEFSRDHPVQAFAAGGVGGALNPVNMALGGAIGDTVNMAGPTARLMALGRATAQSGVIGAGEGALYGSADPNDPLGGAGRGAVSGLIGGAAAVPIGAAVAGAGGALASSARGIIGGPQVSIGEMVARMTPDEIEAVQQLRMQSAAAGTPISMAEAVQHVMGGATGLGRMQRVLEGTRQGQQLFGDYYRDRPAQVQARVNAFADRLAPPTDTPSVLATRAQSAGEQAVRTAQQIRSAATRPSYTAAGAQNVPAADMHGILSDIDSEIAGDRTGLLQGPLGQLRRSLTDPETGEPITDIANLDRARKTFRDRLALPDVNANAYDKEVGGRVGDYIGRLDNVMERTSPDFVRGKQIHADMTRSTVDPVTAGPQGALARANSVPGANAALYPHEALSGAAAETRAAVGALEAHDPGLANELTRQHIQMSLDGSRPEIVGGQNPYWGTNFAIKVAGAPERQAALMAGVSRLPGGAATAQDLADMLSTFRAMGRRERPGSQTAYNASDLTDWHKPPMAKALESASLTEPLEPIAAILSNWNYRRNVRGIGDFLTAPADETAQRLLAAQGAYHEPTVLSLPRLPYQLGGAAIPQLPPPSNRR